MLYFFKIGSVYKTLLLESFKTVPYFCSGRSVSAPKDTIFTVVDITSRYMDVRDDAMYHSPHDISGNVITVTIVYDYRILFLNFHHNSNIAIRPETYFEEIKTFE